MKDVEIRENWRAFVAALVYLVQFDPSPERHVDRVIRDVVHQDSLQATPEDYLRALIYIRESGKQVSDVIPYDYGEETLRRYLLSIEAKLKES